MARAAGVSHQTVSRVLNGHPQVREETRRKVRAAMAELQYRPNRAARTLVTGRSHTLGVVATHTTLFGPASVVAAFEQAAAAAGFSVFLHTVPTPDEGSVRAAVERALDHGVAALAVVVPVASAAAALDGLDAGVPVVRLGGEAPAASARVGIDQHAGARDATRHLLALGHRTVWHVAGPAGWSDSAARVAGWRDALVEAGAEVPPVVPAADWRAASGLAAGRLLAARPDVTAVFAANDSLALGVLQALHERGLDVPGRVSVVGYDDVPEAAHFLPPLTTVRCDFPRVAQEALRLLLDHLDPGAWTDASLRDIRPRLVVRASTAPPSGGGRPRLASLC
ncbi:LacI family DNA-binding transcriptional regulator [Geodermatophilus sp. SYSU D00708]